MITFRYHLVSVAAVLLALAAGVALGSGYLSSSVASSTADRSAPGDDGLTQFETGYAEATSGSLLDGVLDNRDVVVLTLPGARPEEIDGVSADLEDAGATITGQGQLTGRLVDPANRQFAESVAQESANDVESVGEANEAYGRVGAALGRAVLGTGGEDLDEQAQTINAAFVEGDLLAWEDEPSVSASLAVVVSGPQRAGDSGTVVGGMLGAVDAAGDGAVLAGPSRSSIDGGLLAEVRDTEAAARISTVDVTDTAAGRVVTALALARAAEGEDGSWGTSRSADGAVPQ